MSGLPRPAPETMAGVDLSRKIEPAWVIDLDEARVVAASPAGGIVWGGSWREGTALDRAMPALQALIRLSDDGAAAPPGSRTGGAGLRRELLLWTAEGPIRLQCRCRQLPDPHRRRVLVTADEVGLQAIEEHPLSETRSRAVLAHELRTPLSAIAALAEVMKKERLGPMGNARYLAYSKDIYESAQHALNVLATLMGTEDARASSDLASAHADLHGIVAKSFSVMRELARRASVRLETDLAPGRPRVFADGRSLMQILINLISNALKFTPAGGAVTVQTRKAPDGSLTMAVIDTGTGMALGERFEAAPAVGAGSQPRVSGQGLAIVHSLARSSGAKVEISTAPGAGTRVSIVFPPERIVRRGLSAA